MGTVTSCCIGEGCTDDKEVEVGSDVNKRRGSKCRVNRVLEVPNPHYYINIRHRFYLI